MLSEISGLLNFNAISFDNMDSLDRGLGKLSTVFRIPDLSCHLKSKRPQSCVYSILNGPHVIVFDRTTGPSTFS